MLQIFYIEYAPLLLYRMRYVIKNYSDFTLNSYNVIVTYNVAMRVWYYGEKQQNYKYPLTIYEISDRDVSS